MSATELAGSIGYSAGALLSLLLTWFLDLNIWCASCRFFELAAGCEDYLRAAHAQASIEFH